VLILFSRDEGGWGNDSKVRKGEKISVAPSRIASMTNSAMQSAMQVNQVRRSADLRHTSSPVESVKE